MERFLKSRTAAQWAALAATAIIIAAVAYFDARQGNVGLAIAETVVYFGLFAAGMWLALKHPLN
jgi:hypothetical protein